MESADPIIVLTVLVILGAAFLLGLRHVRKDRGTGTPRAGGKAHDPDRDLRESQELAELRARRDEAVRLETRLQASRETIEDLRTENGNLRRLRDEAVAGRHEAERELAVVRSRIAEIEKRLADRETARKESVEAARVAALESSRELGQQLIADHRRESEVARKQQEERVRQATGQLQQGFETIVKNVHALGEDVVRNRTSVETVMRALASPGGAGHFAEIGLENTLKSFGLRAGRDFVMQHAAVGDDGGKLRPDAVVFLPGDTVLVIDSKASKYFLEIAETEGTDAGAEAYAGLSRTMAQHLRNLSNRDYASAVRESCRRAGRDHELRTVMTAMYLPSEAAIERLDIADPEFSRKAGDLHIVPVGPSGLRGLIGLAGINIDLGHQAENQETIVDATRKLLDSVVVALGHAERLGSGLESVAKHFARFTASINNRLVPRSRALAGLGVRPYKQGSGISTLPSFEVMRTEPAACVEDDAAVQDDGTNPNIVEVPLAARRAGNR